MAFFLSFFFGGAILLDNISFQFLKTLNSFVAASEETLVVGYIV